MLQYLEDHFDLSDTKFVGASAGSLLSALTLCHVPAKAAILEAYRLAVEAGAFDRPLGLAGVWGNLVSTWLGTLLPEDAHKRCSGRATIVVARVPNMELIGVDAFATRDELLRSLLASCHVPFVLDGRPWVPWDHHQTGPLDSVMDGSLMEFFDPSRASYHPFYDEGTQHGIVIDYFLDEELEYNRMSFLQLRDFPHVLNYVRRGYEYGRRIHARGELSMLSPRSFPRDTLDLDGVLHEGARIREANRGPGGGDPPVVVERAKGRRRGKRRDAGDGGGTATM
ncbi:unnamed protein product [Pedinophyceae sp. YPF-701]|nr:unnamed protein product [Pedinophyceae sp. YPF-701]